jgi:chorismate dehydratase
VEYLNSVPLVEGIEDQVSFAVPAVLADALRRGDLDAALVPVFEWFSNPVYRAVDGVSIACEGPVLSVVLAAKGAVEKVTSVRLDAASRTSAQLVQIILEEKLGRKIAYLPPDVGSVLKPGEGELFIGDRALRLSLHPPEGLEILDLGMEWKRLAGLPFVFALWLVRAEYPHGRELAEVLREAAARGRTRIDHYAAARACGFEPEVVAGYLSENVLHRCGEREKEGLRMFGQKLLERGVIARADLPEWI